MDEFCDLRKNSFMMPSKLQNKLISMLNNQWKQTVNSRQILKLFWFEINKKDLSFYFYFTISQRNL